MKARSMPTIRRRQSCRTKGFSLTELSIALVLIGLSAGIYMKVNTASTAADCVIATKAQLETINQSITRYVNDKERYPLPAKRNVGVSSNEYGREITDKINYAGIDRHTDSSSGKDILIGALPFQELGLSPSYAGDCWGNKFTYFVTTSLTDSTKFTSAEPSTVYDGEIEVASDNVATDPAVRNAAYAVISHGPNGGSSPNVVANNYTGGSTKIATTEPTTLEGGNYDNTDARVISAPQNATSFDDVVLYSGKKLVSVDGNCKEPTEGGGAHTDSRPVEPPIGDRCLKGKPTAVTAGATFTWSCEGANGGSTEDCSATNTGSGPLPCNLPWGGTINHGLDVKAYKDATAADCEAAGQWEMRTCNNGVLSGGYQHQFCSAPPVCDAWKVGCEPAVTAPGNACEAGGGYLELDPIIIDNPMCGGEWRVRWRCCTGGAPAARCNLPWGGTIAHGQNVTAYKDPSSANCDDAGAKEIRTCMNGTLSGSFTNQSCSAEIDLYLCMEARAWATDPGCNNRIAHTSVAAGRCPFDVESEPKTGVRYCGHYDKNSQVTDPQCIGDAGRGGGTPRTYLSFLRSGPTVYCQGGGGGGR